MLILCISGQECDLAGARGYLEADQGAAGEASDAGEECGSSEADNELCAGGRGHHE